MILNNINNGLINLLDVVAGNCQSFEIIAELDYYQDIIAILRRKQPYLQVFHIYKGFSYSYFYRLSIEFIELLYHILLILAIHRPIKIGRFLAYIIGK